jgi:hypothetical protein
MHRRSRAKPAGAFHSARGQRGSHATRRSAERSRAEKQRVRQQMLARNWHDDAISPELGSFCQKSHLIAGLIDIS